MDYLSFLEGDSYEYEQNQRRKQAGREIVRGVYQFNKLTDSVLMKAASTDEFEAYLAASSRELRHIAEQEMPTVTNRIEKLKSALRKEFLSQRKVAEDGSYDDLDEETARFVEEFTKSEDREPTEDEIAKFRENAYQDYDEDMDDEDVDEDEDYSWPEFEERLRKELEKRQVDLDSLDWDDVKREWGMDRGEFKKDDLVNDFADYYSEDDYYLDDDESDDEDYNDGSYSDDTGVEYDEEGNSEYEKSMGAPDDEDDESEPEAGSRVKGKDRDGNEHEGEVIKMIFGNPQVEGDDGPVVLTDWEEA